MSDRKSCAPSNSGEIRLQLKSRAKQRWPGVPVRISQTGCLGVCEEGPNVMVYPQNLWFRQVTVADVDRILDAVEDFVSGTEESR